MALLLSLLHSVSLIPALLVIITASLLFIIYQKISLFILVLYKYVYLSLSSCASSYCCHSLPPQGGVVTPPLIHTVLLLLCQTDERQKHQVHQSPLLLCRINLMLGRNGHLNPKWKTCFLRSFHSQPAETFWCCSASSDFMIIAMIHKFVICRKIQKRHVFSLLCNISTNTEQQMLHHERNALSFCDVLQ